MCVFLKVIQSIAMVQRSNYGKEQPRIYCWKESLVRYLVLDYVRWEAEKIYLDVTFRPVV